MQSKTIKLLEPVEFGSETISELSLRRPRVKDLRKFPANAKTLGEMIDFAGHLCGQPPSVMDMLSIEDGMRVFEELMDFLPDSLKTGDRF